MFEVGIQKANDEYDKIYGEIMKLVELGKGGIDLKVKFEQTTELKRFVEAIKQVGDGKLLEPLLNKIEQLQVSMVKLGMVPKVNYNDLANQLNKVTRAYEDYQASIKKHGEGSAVAKQYFEGWQAQVGKLEKVFEMPEKVAREALNTYQNLGNTVVSNMERIGGSKAGMETLAHSVNDMASSVEILTKKIGGLVTEMSNLGKVKATEKIAGDLSDADKGTKQIAVALKNAMDKLKASKGEVSEAERELDRSTNSTNNALAVEKENVAALANELKTAERAIHSAAVAAKELSVILGGNSEGVNKFIALASTMDALNLKQASIMTDKNLTFDAKREQLEGVRKEMDAVAKEMDELKKNAAVGNPLVEAFTTAFTSLNTALTNSGNLLSKAATGLGDVDEQLSKVMVKASKEIKLGGNTDAQKKNAQDATEATQAINKETEAVQKLKNELEQLSNGPLKNWLDAQSKRQAIIDNWRTRPEPLGIGESKKQLHDILDVAIALNKFADKNGQVIKSGGPTGSSTGRLIEEKDAIAAIAKEYKLTNEEAAKYLKMVNESTLAQRKFHTELKDGQLKIWERGGTSGYPTPTANGVRERYYREIEQKEMGAHAKEVARYRQIKNELSQTEKEGAQSSLQAAQSEQKVADANKNSAQSAKEVVAALRQKADAEKSAQSATDGGKAAKDAQNTTAAVNEEAEAFRKLMTEMNTFKGSIESLVGSIRSLVEQLQKMHTSTPQIIDNNALLAQAKVVEDLRKKLTSMTLKGDSGMLVPKEGVKAEEALRVQDKLTAEQQKFNEVLTRGASVVGSYAEAIQQLGHKYNLTAEQAARLASLIGSGELKRGDVQQGLRIGYNKAGDIVETINALKQLKQVESQPTPATQSVFDQSKFTGLQEAIDKVIKEVNRLQEAFKHLGENNSLSNLSTTVNGLAVTLSTLSNAFKFTANTEELAAYEAKIKSLQQTIAQLEAKATGLSTSLSNASAGIKTQAEKAGNESTLADNLQKLKTRIAEVQAEFNRLNETYGQARTMGMPVNMDIEQRLDALRRLIGMMQQLEEAAKKTQNATQKEQEIRESLSKSKAFSFVQFEGNQLFSKEVGKLFNKKDIDAYIKSIEEYVKANGHFAQSTGSARSASANLTQMSEAMRQSAERANDAGRSFSSTVTGLRNFAMNVETARLAYDKTLRGIADLESRISAAQKANMDKESIDFMNGLKQRAQQWADILKKILGENMQGNTMYKEFLSMSSSILTSPQIGNMFQSLLGSDWKILMKDIGSTFNMLMKFSGFNKELTLDNATFANLMKGEEAIRRLENALKDLNRQWEATNNGAKSLDLTAKYGAQKQAIESLIAQIRGAMTEEARMANRNGLADLLGVGYRNAIGYDNTRLIQEMRSSGAEKDRVEKDAQRQAEAIRAAEEAKRNERNKAWIEQDAQRKKELEAIEKQGAKTLQAQQTANEKSLASAQKADEQKAKSAENAAKRREEANERATIKEREAVLRKEQELYQKQANKAANDRTKSASDAVVEYKRLEDIITRLNALGVKAIGANVDTTKVDDLIHRLEILQRIYKNIYEGGGRDAAGRSFGDIKGVDQVRATMLDIRSIFTEIPQKIRESEQATKLVANAERSIQSEIDKTLSLRKKIEASIARGEAAGRDMSGLKAQNDALEKQVNLLKAVKSGIKAGTVSPTDNILTKRIQETQLLRDDTEMLRKSQERLNAAQEKANKAKDKQAQKTLKDEIKSVDDAWEKYNKLGVKIQELKDLRERGINANIDTSSVLAYINNLEQLRTLLKEIFSYNGRTLSTGSIGSANFSQGMLFKDVMKNFNGAGIEDANKYNLKGFKQNLSDAEANMRKAERAAAALDVKIQNIEARKLDFKDLDTSRLDAAIQRLREIQTELIRVATGMYGTRFSVADVTKTMNLAGANREVTNATKELQAAQTSAASAVRQMAIEEQRLDKALHEVNNSAKTQSQMMSDLKMMATQYLGVWGAQQFFRNIIEIGGQLEKQRLSLRAILGDAAQAEELFSDIKKLAIKSPFGVVELDQFTKQLSAYGFKYNELFDMTKRLADISAGAGTEVSRLALALGHVRAEGALSGYTLRQFAMNNIPMVQKLSERFTQLEGKIVSVSDIRKRVSKKEIGYEDVEAVIKDLTNEGGMFYNMQEVISESVQAKFKNLKDSMDIMYGEMAQGAMGDVLKVIANSLTALTRQWKVLLPVIGAATAYWGMQKLAVMGVNAQITKYGVAAKVLTGQTYKLTAEQVKNLAVTGQISQRQLLIAVASRRLTVEQAELAASTYGLSKAQLQEVFASGAVEKSMLGSSVATSKYTIAQLRAMAATKVTATGIGWLDGALTRVKRAWLGASAASSKFWVSLKAMSSSIAWLAAIELAVTAITRAMQKSSERSERMSSMLETAREGFKNMNQNAVNFKVGVSLELSESELRTQIDAMKQELKEYSPQVGNVFAEAFKLDKSGKNVHTMAEQYEILAKAIDDTKDAYKEFEKIADLFELSNDATDGVWDDSLRENISDYIGTLKEQRSAEFELLKNRIKLSSSIEALRNDYESLNTVLQENFEQYKKSGGKLGFSEDDILKQIELIKSYGQEYEKNFKNLNKGLPGYVGDEEASKLQERKRIYDAFNKSVYGELSEYNKAVNKSQYQWQKVVEDGAVYTSNLVRSLEIVFKKSASNFNKAEQLAVQKGIQTFLNGIDGFKDLAREERIKIEKELLKPFPNIKIDVEVEDAYQQLTSFQQYLQSITSKAWTVNIKTLNTISDVAEAGRKNRKENEQTLKDTSGILKKSGYENKRLQSLGKALYEEGKIQQATADAVDATENLNNTLRTDWGGMQVQADKTNESLSSTQKAINDYVDGMKDATEEQKKAARERIQAYANEEANKALEERGYDLSDNKSKGRGEDKKAKEMREQIKLIKDAYDWYKKYDDELKWSPIDAFAEIKSKYGQTLGKLGIKWDDEKKGISEYRDSLQLLLDKAEKLYQQPKHKNSYMMDVIKELKDAIQQTDFDKLKKSAEDTASAMTKMLNNLTQQWSIYKNVLAATGNRVLAQQLAGLTGIRTTFDTQADDIKSRIIAESPNVDFSKVLVMSGKEIEEYVGTLGLAKDKIDAIINALKEWKKTQEDLIKTDITSFASLIGGLKDYETEIQKIDTELEEQKKANERLATTINPDTGKPYITKEQQQKADRIAEVQAEDKKWQKSTLYINLMNNTLALTKKEIEQGLIRAQDILNQKLAEGVVSAKEYADEMAKIRELQRNWDKNSIFGKSNVLTSYLTGGESGLRGYLNSTLNKYNTKIGKKEQLTEKEQKDFRNAQKTQRGLDMLDNSVGKAKLVFDTLAGALQPVIDLFNQLGMEDVGKVIGGVQNVMGGAMQGGMAGLAMASVLGPSAGLYGAVIGGGLSLVSTLASSIFGGVDEAMQAEIEASKQRQKEMENLTKNMEKVLERALGGIYNFSKTEQGQKEKEEFNKMVQPYLQQVEKRREYENNLKTVEDFKNKHKSDYDSWSDWMKARAKALEAERNANMYEFHGGKRRNYTTDDTYDAIMKAQDTGELYDMKRANLLMQKDELQHQIDSERRKKDSDDGAISDWEQQIKELDDEIKNFALDMAEALYSIDIKSLAQEFGDAIVTAWENGEDASKAYAGSVKSTMKKLAKNILQQKIMEQAFKNSGIEDLIVKMMDTTSGQLDYSHVADLSAALQGLGKRVSDAYTAVLDDLYRKGAIDKDSSSGNKGLASNIKTITEETAELLASYLNAVRADVAVNRQMIAQYFPLYYNAMTSGNQSLTNIENHTAAIMNSNDAIRQSNQELLDMVKGLKNRAWEVPVA